MSLTALSLWLFLNTSSRRNTMHSKLLFITNNEEECADPLTRVYYHSKMKPRRIPLFHSVQLVLVDIAFEALVAACDPLLASPQA